MTFWFQTDTRMVRFISLSMQTSPACHWKMHLFCALAKVPKKQTVCMAVIVIHVMFLK